MSTSPHPTEQSLGVYQLKKAFADMDEVLTRHAIERPEGLVLEGEEGALALADATQRLGAETQTMLSRIRNRQSSDEFVASLLDGPYLESSLVEVLEVLVNHGHGDTDSESGEPIGEGDRWLSGEPINLSLWATVKMARRAFSNAIRVAIHGPDVQEDLSGRPARALNNALSDIQLAGWKFNGAMKRLERARRMGQIPDSQAGVGLCYVRLDDEPIEQVRLDVNLEMMAINPFFPWMRDRGIAAGSVFDIARGIVLARSLIGPVRPLMDDSKDPSVKQWTTRLLILLDKMLEALSKCNSASLGAAPPLVSALGAGVADEFEPLLRGLHDIRQQLHAVDRQMLAAGSTGCSPEVRSLTAEALETKIVQEQLRTQVPLAEAALEIVLNDLRTLHANLPAWQSVHEHRAAVRSTTLSMLNVMGQGINSAEALSKYQREAAQLQERVGVPASPLLIQLAEYGVVLARRGQRAVVSGGSYQLDQAYNPGAKVKSIELSKSLGSAEGTFQMLKVALESESLSLSELLAEVESNQRKFKEWHELFLSSLGLVPPPSTIATDVPKVAETKAEPPTQVLEPKPGVWKTANWIRQAIKRARDFDWDTEELIRAVKAGKVPANAVRGEDGKHREYNIHVLCEVGPCVVYKAALLSAIADGFNPPRSRRKKAVVEAAPPSVSAPGKARAQNMIGG